MGLDQPAAEDLQPRDRRLSDEQLDDFYRRFVCAFNALAQNESSKKIVRHARTPPPTCRVQLCSCAVCRVQLCVYVLGGGMEMVVVP